MEPTQTNSTPPQQPEPKKSFWAKLFGGGKKQQASISPQSNTQDTLNSQDVSFKSAEPEVVQQPPVGSVEPSTADTPTVPSTPLSPTTPDVTPEEASAVDAALNTLSSPLPSSPQSPSFTSAPPNSGIPTPPSDPMVTPAPNPNPVVPPSAVPPLAAPSNPSQPSIESPVSDSDQQSQNSDERPPLTPPLR